MEKKFSHIDEQGKAKMVDVSAKDIQHRMAIAEGKIFLQPDTIELIRENKLKKGDVLSVAQIAGIQAAKKTPELIPLCHPIFLHYIDVQLNVGTNHILITSTVKCDERTGVEMEAIIAVQVALSTVYDMCKAVDKEMVIGEIRLIKKLKS
jgi:cyclic pyranopterin monophosphate synthase